MMADPMRHLHIEDVDGIAVARFVQSKIVTEEDIQELGEQLAGLVDDRGHRRILLDFGNVRYLSSAALGKLINLKKKVSRVDGQIKLCSIHPDLIEVFKITRLDTVFDIQHDERAALDAFRRS